MHFNSKEEKPSKFIFNPIKVICYWEDCFKMSNELDLPLRQYQKKNKFSMSWVKKSSGDAKSHKNTEHDSNS